MLVSGSELSGQRRRQGAKMMASAPGDMRFTSSSRATLHGQQQLGGPSPARRAPKGPEMREEPQPQGGRHGGPEIPSPARPWC